MDSSGFGGHSFAFYMPFLLLLGALPRRPLLTSSMNEDGIIICTRRSEKTLVEEPLGKFIPIPVLSERCLMRARKKLHFAEATNS
jgi:hypothetical protein